MWLCRTKDNQDVAIKLLDQNIMQDENTMILEMFSNEIEIAEKLRHKHIVSLISHDISDDYVYIVMEYVDGASMDYFVQPGKLLSVKQVIEYAIPVCEALGFAALQGFIHCDIKPANIFLSRQGIVKISDFGAGMRLHNGRVQPEIVIGSPAYMSPEHAQGLEIGAASDIYSFGVTLYRLTTGRLPFFAPQNAELIKQVLSKEPIRPSALRPDMPAMLDTIIMRCLRKLAQDRYASWELLADDLRALSTVLQLQKVREAA